MTRHWGIHILYLVFFSIVASAFGKTAPILSAGDQVWFATEYGLHRYDKAQEEWSVFFSGNGLAGNVVHDIGIDEGIIWVATDEGVSNSYIRFSDWRSYTTNDGLPGNDVRCVAFSEDYVWVGTEAGAARFDKLLEEWESYTTADGLTGDRVNDVAVEGQNVWFATSSGVSRLEVEFDRWTSYTSEGELPSGNVSWALVLGEYVWFVTDKGLARYDKRLRGWKSYSMADGIVSYLVNDVVIAGENIWLATENGVSSYDPVSDSWSVEVVYHNMLPSRNVRDIARDGDVTWFCTDKGVSSYDAAAGSWRHYTTADGLLDNNGQGLIVSGQVFAVTERGVNLYDKKTQEWEVYEFPEETSEEAAEGRRERGLRLDEQGIGFDLSREAQVRLSGYSWMEFVDDSHLRPNRTDEYEWYSRSDLSLRGVMPGGRSTVGFYDDTDQEDVEYGFTYRGNNTDFLQGSTGGEFQVKARNSEFIYDINMLGGGALMRKRFDGVRLNLEPRYGQQRGIFETDFFTYRTGTTIYELSHPNVIPDTDEVRAGKQKLRPGADYIMVYPAGWLVFHREELLEEGEEIEVRYQYEPADEEESRRLAILTTGIDLWENYYVGVDMLHGDDLDLVTLNGEGENMRMGPVSMKFRPEVAYSRRQGDGDTADGVASRAELTANARRTQFRAEYERYEEDFWTTGRRETRFGLLDRRIDLFSQVDVAQWMPVTLQWQRERARDDIILTTEDDVTMNVVVSRKPYPTIALTGKRDTAKSPKHEESENAARADFQYELPGLLLSPIGFRRAEIKGYYREARGKSVDEHERMRTGYAKLILHPVERFVISTSYTSNVIGYKEANSESYSLREELQRLLIRSSFASIDGLISTINVDDIILQSRSDDGMTEDRDSSLGVSLNLIPGAWVQRLQMLTLAGTYSLIQQTVPVGEPDSEGAEDQRADSNSRSMRLKANLRPHSALLWTGTYQRLKSWIQDIPPTGNIHKYRSEVEFKPGSKHRIMLGYYQEREDEDNTLQRSLYSPSLWWEIRWSGRWTTRIRGLYERDVTHEEKTSETASTFTPGFSFRYTARELPHGGRLYISQGFSVSISRAERAGQNSPSETYSTSFISEWKITRNLSLRLRASLSYEDDRTEGGSDAASAHFYARAMARF